MKVTAIGPIGIALLLSGAVCLTSPASWAASAESVAGSQSIAETDLSGNWEVQTGTEAGAYAAKLVLRRDGSGYKGTFTMANGESFELTGTLKSQGIEFRSADGGVYPARLVGGLLRGTYTQDGAEQSWTARRPKTSAAQTGITGRWKVSMDGPNGRTFEREMTLKQEGDKVTGVLKAATNLPANAGGGGNGGGGGGGRFRRDIEITNGTFKNDELLFVNEFDRNGTPVRFAYRATLKGDTLEGTIEGGQNLRKWRATRISDGSTTAATASGLSGSWTMTSEGRNGNPIERELVLIQDGDRITGTLKAPTNLPAGAGGGGGNGGGGGGGAFRRDIEIREATFSNNELKFTTEMSFNNNTIRRTYTATLSGDTLEGTSQGTGGQGGQGGTPRKWRAVRNARSAQAQGLEGVWDLTIHAGQQDYKAVVTIKNEGGSLAGEYVSQGQPNSPEIKAPLKPVSLTGKEVKFSVDLPIALEGQNTLHIDFTGTMDGDTVKGDQTSRFGTSAWDMKRRAGASASASASGAAGEWVLTMEGENGPSVSTVFIRNNGGQWSGEFQRNGGSTLPLKSVTVAGSNITLIRESNRNGRTMKWEYTGRIEGDRITGTMKSPSRGGFTGTSTSSTGTTTAFSVKTPEEMTAFTATRKQPLSPDAVAGEWTLNIDRDGTPYTPTLVLRHEGGQWAGEGHVGSGRSVPLKNVTLEGDRLRFGVTLAGDQTSDMEFSGKISGRMMAGSVKTPKSTHLFTGERKRGAQTAANTN